MVGGGCEAVEVQNAFARAPLIEDPTRCVHLPHTRPASGWVAQHDARIMRGVRVLPLLAIALTLLSCSDEPPGGPGDGGFLPTGDGGTITGPDGGPLLGVDGSTITCISGLTALELSPASSTVSLRGSTPDAITYAATGVVGGRRRSVPNEQLAWFATRADDSAPGSVVNGVFQPLGGVGGRVTVHATDGCVEGLATVDLVLEVSLGVPPSPGAFDGTPVVGGAEAPLIVYPSDETRFPRNIFRTLFQWRTGTTTNFRLTFEGPAGKVTVYTDGAHPLCADKNPAAGCWEADEQAWSFIAGSNAGEVVTWTVDGLDGSTVRRSDSIRIGFSRRDVAGAIFYWSTTSAGIRRANVRDANPEDYITGKPKTRYPSGTEVRCVACHTLSRDGRYMAAPVQATSGDSLWVMEVTGSPPPTPLLDAIPDTKGHGWATFSPDSAEVVAAWKGKLWSLDRASGTKLYDISVGAGMAKGTHPDWSPDDRFLAIATGEGDAPGNASIALLRRNAAEGRFGAPEVLVPSVGGVTHLFPMFSPDGQWIAFSSGSGGHGDDEAQLQVVRAELSDPRPTAIELVRANRVVSNRVTDGQHQNSLPTWAPPGDLAWVAFNSKREYGVVSDGRMQQIWVAAVDLSKAEAGEDPSYPAFRLQFQGLEENNHRAFWTLDVRDPPPDAGVPDGTADAGVDAGGDGGLDPGGEGDAGMCIANQELCDPVDDVCCDGASLCNTNDNGETYRCLLSF